MHKEPTAKSLDLKIEQHFTDNMSGIRRRKRYDQYFILDLNVYDIRKDLKICVEGSLGNFKDRGFTDLASAGADLPGDKRSAFTGVPDPACHWCDRFDRPT